MFVYRIAKNKEMLLSSATRKSNSTHMKNSENLEIEEALVLWLQNMLAQKIPVDGPLLREKALQVAEQLKKNEFQASEGLLTNVKERHGLVFKSVQGEDGAVRETEYLYWLNNILPELLKPYDPNAVFNADELAIFYSLLPDKTLTFKGQKCSGGKRSKLRLTVLLGANMTGTQKLPLLVIAKHKKPRCFKNMQSLSVQYQSNSKAWMTRLYSVNGFRR